MEDRPPHSSSPLEDKLPAARHLDLSTGTVRLQNSALFHEEFAILKVQQLGELEAKPAKRSASRHVEAVSRKELTTTQD